MGEKQEVVWAIGWNVMESGHHLVTAFEVSDFFDVSVAED